jgi:signal transduction histidine kinase/DNA-binding NarL/FixJ family response regulator
VSNPSPVAPSAAPARNWLRFSNLKLEATVFMLIALTFAAVLGQEAFTSRTLDLSRKAAQYYAFVYGDYQEGGKSTATFDNAVPLKWSCDLKPGVQYAYCGYGLHLDVTNTGTGLDFSQYQKIKLRLNYQGVGDHVRIALQTAVPSDLGIEVKPGDTIPLVAEFVVKQGDNDIELTVDQFTIESWWLSSRNLTPDKVKPPLDRVMSVGFSSGSATPHGQFTVTVKSLQFEGTSLTTAQWYLVILGVWLVLTGGFLVFRFFGMRRTYEARQRHLAEEQAVLAKAHAAAESASAAKSQFLANMSHELRTPLNAIIGYAQLLRTRKLDDQDMTAVKTIHHSGEHLLTMITDILDIAKVEAGKFELLPASFDIHACVRNVGQMVRLRGDEKGLEVVVDIAAGVPQTVIADQKRLRQVLINLLGNAIKFTSEGEVRLDVSVVSFAEGEVRLRLDVIDTGLGIPDDDIGRIFRPFEQTGNAVSRSGGTGLGLSITHQIVEMMGGTITVESTLGQGSRFSVELPLPLSAAETGDAPVVSSLGDACGRYDILIADDTESNRVLLRSALEAQGFRVRDAGNGAQAIEQMREARPDLVLMDLRMPVMDGLDAMRAIRKDAELSAVPVIALSANPSPEKEALAIQAGANRLLPKPVDLAALAAVMAELLSPGNSPAVSDEPVMVAPPAEVMAHLLALARAGNLRAIRKEIPVIAAEHPHSSAFMARLDSLCAAYQSPAVLRLIELHSEDRAAA